MKNTSKKASEITKKTSKEKFFKLKRKKIYLKSELDATKQLSSKQLSLNKPIKKLKDFKKFEDPLKKSEGKDQIQAKISDLIDLTIEKNLVLKVNKELSLLKVKNMSKKVDGVTSFLASLSPDLKKKIQPGIFEALNFILLRKFSTVYFGKSFKIFTEVPEKHLTQTLKSQIKAYNSSMKFLTMMKEQDQSLNLVVDSEKIELIHSRFKFLIANLSNIGISFNNDLPSLPNCLDKNEIREIEVADCRKNLERGFRIFFCLMAKILLLSHNYWIIKLSGWIAGDVIGDELEEKELYALESCIDYIRGVIKNYRVDDLQLAEQAYSQFENNLMSIVAFRRLLENQGNRESLRKRILS